MDGHSKVAKEKESKSSETSPFQPDWLPSFLIWRKRGEGPLRDTFRFGLENFISTFRACSPYISAHQNSIFVIHIPGQLVEEELFETTIQDIALLNILGVKVVLVAGSRPQIDSRLSKEGVAPHFSHGFRVTDSIAMKAVKDAAGFVRYEIESKLSRGVFNTPTLNKVRLFLFSNML